MNNSIINNKSNNSLHRNNSKINSFHNFTTILCFIIYRMYLEFYYKENS